MNNFSYKNLCPFKWFVLQNFPFIEADFDAITNWQLFCKLGEEMNKIIEKVNQAGEQTENLTNAFIELQNYVNDYFENLNVQDEINNKLDEMSESGELAEIISEFVTNNKLILNYNNIVEMSSDSTIQPFQFLQTFGYYNKNDGGSAKYFVTQNIDNIEENDGFHILLENGLVANLLIENSQVNIKQLGAKPYDGQYKTDIVTYLNYYMNNVKSSVVTLFIPAGLWHCSGFTFNHSFSLKGVKDYTINYVRGTYITSLNNNQDFIFSIGDSLNATTSFSLENISFTTCEGSYLQHSGTELRILLDSNTKRINNACLKFINANFGFVKNINFYGIIGKAMTMSSSWEITFDDINFQSISNIDDYIVSFETVNNLQSNSNISNCVFKYIRFEEIHGGLFEVQQNAILVGNDFYCISFEDRRLINIANITNENYSNDYSNFNDNTAIHHPLFDLKGFCRRKYNTLYYY